MSTPKIFHCIVDDTALITNISEIETWVARGLVTLILPLHTLERLHLLKKDSSQIGMNARKAVKFLDRITSSKEGLAHDPVVLQGPDDQYATWSEVEAHYVEQDTESGTTDAVDMATPAAEHKHAEGGLDTLPEPAGGPLSQLLLDRLNFAKNGTSPMSTPPLSPASSGPQSSKTSPEIKSASMISNDASPVPPSLKPLINPVVWYTHEKKANFPSHNLVFLTNSADTAHLARDFGILSKNIHQLRSAIGVEEQELKNHDKYQKKHSRTSSIAAADSIPVSSPKPLFRYEDDESEEEEVIFKPRGSGAVRAMTSARGTPTAIRGVTGHSRSPTASFSTPAQPAQVKPQIPVEEIDPDSFDRGGFGRGSTPLVNTGSYGHTYGNSQNHFNGVPRGSLSRGNFTPTGPLRGTGHHRGAARGLDRGSSRGRGRLFVP